MCVTQSRRQSNFTPILLNAPMYPTRNTIQTQCPLILERERLFCFAGPWYVVYYAFIFIGMYIVYMGFLGKCLQAIFERRGVVLYEKHFVCCRSASGYVVGA